MSSSVNDNLWLLRTQIQSQYIFWSWKQMLPESEPEPQKNETKG